MDQARAALADRLRALLAAIDGVEERSMFGTRAFLVRDRLVVCARAGGDLLVRVDAGRSEALTARPGAAQAHMGSGRSMGAGWIDVRAEAIAPDAALADWVGEALRHRAGS